MIKLLCDAVGWLFSKGLVVLAITVTAVGLTLILRYSQQQEKALREKSELQRQLAEHRKQTAETEQHLNKSNAKLRDATSQLQQTVNRLDKHREQLTSGNAMLKPAKDAMQKATAAAEVSTRSAQHYANEFQKAARVTADLSRQLDNLYAKRPDPLWHPLDYLHWVNVKWNPSVKVYNSSKRKLQDAEVIKQRAEKAAHDALKRADNAKRNFSELVRKYTPNPRVLQELEAAANRSKNEQTRISQERSRLEIQFAKLKDDEARLEEQVDDLSAQVRWYEGTKREVGVAFLASRDLILITTLAVFGGPITLKAFWFFVLARLATFAPAIQLKPSNTGCPEVTHEQGPLLKVPLSSHTPLVSRPDWIVGWPPGVQRCVRFLWNWKAPLISYGAGLSEMTSMALENSSADAHVTLNSSRDPLMHIGRINLADHPGFVARPGYVVAISGDIAVETKWNLFNLHAWVSGSIRRIIFSGTGSLYFKGYGGVYVLDTTAQPDNVDHNLLVAYDSRNRFSTVRTETFWHYLTDAAPLFLYSFSGPGPVFMQRACSPEMRKSDNPLKRVVDMILGAVGKLLGF